MDYIETVAIGIGFVCFQQDVTRTEDRLADRFIKEEEFSRFLRTR